MLGINLERRSIAVVVALAACLGSDVRATPKRRAVYVRDASALTATPRSRNRLDQLLDRRQVTDVIPYGLGPLLETVAGRTAAAAWIDELHRHGARVSVPVAGHDRLRALDAMLAEHPTTVLDGMVTENEFWNRADRVIAFEEMIALVADMRIQAALWSRHGHAIPVGAYVGYPTAVEASRLAAAVDFVFLDYTVGSPERAWSHVHPTGPLRQRFAWFAVSGVEMWPIFYTAGEVDMSASLRAQGTSAAEARFRGDLAADHDLGKYPVAGFVYFTIESMPDPH